jgi:hypothetical protein
MNMSLILRLGQRAWPGVRAFLFVVVALLSWWLFASLADFVVRCAPWGNPWGAGCRPTADPRSRIDKILLIISLLPALWVAQKLLFSSDDRT